MKPKVVISPGAVDEITQSIEWYNNQRKGLGKRFYSNLRSLIKTIQRSPLAFEIKYENFLGALMDDFPLLCSISLLKQRHCDHRCFPYPPKP